MCECHHLRLTALTRDLLRWLVAHLFGCSYTLSSALTPQDARASVFPGYASGDCAAFIAAGPTATIVAGGPLAVKSKPYLVMAFIGERP
jgi:hypothetical protein